MIGAIICKSSKPISFGIKITGFMPAKELKKVFFGRIKANLRE